MDLTQELDAVQGRPGDAPATSTRLRAIVRLWLPWLIIAAGIGLRCSQYAADRSLFLDEAFVATNLTERSISELMQPLEFDQRAPGGFLAAVKLVTLWLGHSDLALRLVPLLAGVLSVVMFHWLARRLLTETAALIALGLFAFSHPLIFLASDLKQYSTDALATIAILLATWPLAVRGGSALRVVALGLTGAVAVWFSFPAVFVLAAVGVTLALPALRQRDYRQIVRLAVVAGLWGLGLGTMYFAQIRFFEDEPGWKKLWDDAFMPFPPRSFGDLVWLARRFMHIVTNPIGLEFSGVAGLCCLAGGVAISRRSWQALALLAGPVAVALLASGLRVYPVSGRSIVFVAPLVALLIAAGLDSIRTSCAGTNIRWMWGFLALCVAYMPVMSVKEHLRDGRLYRNTTFWDYKLEEMKPLLAHVRARWQPGDVVYLYSQSYVAFEHYADQYGFAPEDSVRGIMAGLLAPRWDEIESDLARLSGRERVWVLFTHNWTLGGVNDRRLYCHFLDRLGTRRDTLELEGDCDGAVYLYDLSAPPSPAGGRPPQVAANQNND